MSTEDLSEDVLKALDVARRLIKAGVPVFAASPCPEGCPGVKRTQNRDGTWLEIPHQGAPGRYHLPRMWEKTVVTERYLDPNDQIGWRPGWALAAVGGHVVDFLDNDPRNGGDTSLSEVVGAGHMPFILGQQVTPSGGEHYVIHPTGLRKSTNFLPGLDLQSGDETGQGRGFVWIAPTVRPSKDPANAGELVSYRWLEEPAVDQFGEFTPGSDPSLTGLIDRVSAKRAARTEPRERISASQAGSGQPEGFGGIFATPGQVAGLGFGNDRSFTLAEALAFVRPFLDEVEHAPIGAIEETANTAAAALSHFVPAFWTADQGFMELMRALGKTAYDPNGPSDWTADKFLEVLDGRRPPLDDWRAERRPDPVVAPSVTIEAAPGEENLSTIEKLKKLLVSASELAELPPPQPLVHGLLNLDTEAWIIGAAGSLKSFIALDIAGHVAAGKPWQGHRVEKHPVLYLVAEGARGMTLRVRAWLSQHGSMEGVTFLPYPVQVKSADGQWDALVQIAAELRPGWILLDTQHRISTGLEENSATDMGILISAIGRLRRATGACVTPIHHTGRNGGDARGSSALDGAQDTELKVVRAEPRESLMVSLLQDKQKDMAEGARSGIQLAMKIVPLGTGPHGEPLSSLVVDPDRDAVDRAMRSLEGVTEAELDPFKGAPTEAWTKHVKGVSPAAKVQRYILQVLADHAADLGLTEDKAKKAVVARWYSGKSAPDSHNWLDAWGKIVSNPIAVNLGGARWALDQAILTQLKLSHPA